MTRETFFHEDDFGQIEVLPLSTMDFCFAQIENIRNFSNKHQSKDGYGWSDVFVRADAPTNIASLNIKKDDISAALNSTMIEYERVYTGYSSYRELCSRTIAYGDEQTGKIFFTYDENDVVISMWCRELVLEVCKLPQKNKLLVTDWLSGFSCPLNNIEEIEKFITLKSEKIRESSEKWHNLKSSAQEKTKWWKALFKALLNFSRPKN